MKKYLPIIPIIAGLVTVGAGHASASTGCFAAHSSDRAWSYCPPGGKTHEVRALCAGFNGSTGRYAYGYWTPGGSYDFAFCTTHEHVIAVTLYTR